MRGRALTKIAYAPFVANERRHDIFTVRADFNLLLENGIRAALLATERSFSRNCLRIVLAKERKNVMSHWPRISPQSDRVARLFCCLQGDLVMDNCDACRQ